MLDWGVVILWVLIAVVLTIIIIMTVLLVSFETWRNYLLGEYAESLAEYCDNLGPIVYDYAMYVPEDPAVYEKPLAQAMYDIAENVSNANCQQALPLPNPPGFTEQVILYGVDPITQLTMMFGYIFYNPRTKWACFAFTGTSNISQWQSDFDYTLTPATALNGYEPGVEVHRGFYGIYLAVRQQLLTWYSEHVVKVLFLTGHSLGGALSTICAYDFADLDACSTNIHYGFGAPRSGNVKYSEVFNSRVPQSIRVGNTEDIITAMPPATWHGNTYQHTGQYLPFTISLGSLVDDHIKAYAEYLPEEAQVADSKIVDKCAKLNQHYVWSKKNRLWTLV